MSSAKLSEKCQNRTDSWLKWSAAYSTIVVLPTTQLPSEHLRTAAIWVSMSMLR